MANIEWIDVRERTPEPGEQVVALRPNGTWDRAEFRPFWYGGELSAWFMPEGPVPAGTWAAPIDGAVRYWLPIPPRPEGK